MKTDIINQAVANGMARFQAKIWNWAAKDDRKPITAMNGSAKWPAIMTQHENPASQCYSGRRSWQCFLQG